jgi:DNA-binding transcriptional LysR family regulator
MELRHLRYFVAVAGEESVTRAAARLHVSQPGLSRQIHDLEEELGFAILARSRKGVRLTEAGRVFWIDAQAILARVEEAVAAARSVASGKSGKFHVGYAPSLAFART